MSYTNMFVNKNIKKKNVFDPNVKKVKEYYNSIKDNSRVTSEWKRYFENEKNINKSPKFSERLIVMNYKILQELIPNKDLQDTIRLYITTLKSLFKKY